MRPFWILNMVLTSDWWRLIGGECVCALAIKTSDFLSTDSEHPPLNAISAFQVPTHIWCDKNILFHDKLRYFHAVLVVRATGLFLHKICLKWMWFYVNKIQEAHDHIHISMKTFVCTFAPMCSRLKMSFYLNRVLRMYNLCPYNLTYPKSEHTDMCANVEKMRGHIWHKTKVNKCPHYTYIRICFPRCPTGYSSWPKISFTEKKCVAWLGPPAVPNWQTLWFKI